MADEGHPPPGPTEVPLFAVGDLPPPVVPPTRPTRRVSRRGVPGRQLSVLGVEATEPSPADLTGLLLGPGQLGRMGGTARVSVQVDAAWRVHVLVTEIATRGLEVGWEQRDDAPTAFTVRTAYTRRLAALARGWPPPSGQPVLTAPGLRLWVAAAGGPADDGYALGLGEQVPPERAVAAVARLGLAVTADPTGLRVVGRRGLSRLAELVGERPTAAPAAGWPTAG